MSYCRKIYTSQIDFHNLATQKLYVVLMSGLLVIHKDIIHYLLTIKMFFGVNF